MLGSKLRSAVRARRPWFHSPGLPRASRPVLRWVRYLAVVPTLFLLTGAAASYWYHLPFPRAAGLLLDKGYQTVLWGAVRVCDPFGHGRRRGSPGRLGRRREGRREADECGAG